MDFSEDVGKEVLQGGSSSGTGLSLIPDSTLSRVFLSPSRLLAPAFENKRDKSFQSK